MEPFSLNAFIFFSGILSIALGAGRLVRRLEMRTVVLSSFLVCLGFLQILSALSHAKKLADYPALSLLLAPAVLLAGPLVYLLYRTVFEESTAVKPSVSLHFLPSVILAGFLAWQPAFTMHSEFRLVKIGAVASVLLYITSCFLQIKKLWGRERARSRAWSGLLTTGLYFVLAFAAWIGLLLDTEILTLAVNAGTGVFITAFFLAEQRHPDLVNSLAREARKRREQSYLGRLDLAALKDRIMSLMEKERLYCDEDITLPRLAEMAGVTAHQLSEFLNQHMNRSFNRFINDFRVQEARSLLLEQPDRTVLSIGLAVGFNSNSAFHAAFRESTGLTPARFRKQSVSLDL